MATTASWAPSPGAADEPAPGRRGQPANAKPDSCHRRLGLELTEEAERRRPELSSVARGCRRHHRGRDRLGLLDLEHHAHLTGRKSLGGEAATERGGALPDASKQNFEIPGGAVEHEPLTPCPLHRHRVDSSAVLTTRQPVQPEPIGTELSLQVGGTQGGHRAETVEPEGREPGGDRRIDGEHVEGQRHQEKGFVAGANPADPPGMARTRRQAGDESRSRDAHGDLRIEHAAQSARQGGRPGGFVGKLCVATGEIAECLLVTGLHRGREPVELGADGGAQPCDPVGIEGHEHSGWAVLLRLAKRLPHPDPGHLRRLRSGDNRKSQLRSTAKDHRLSAQLRIAAKSRQQAEGGWRAQRTRTSTSSRHAGHIRDGQDDRLQPRDDHAGQPDHLGGGVGAG